MTAILQKFSLFYGSVPKVACTSIKHMFFEAENGFTFSPFTVNGRRKNIHNVAYPGKLRENYPEKLIEDFFRVTVVRDPIKRFLSAYSNRVVYHKELSINKAGENLRSLDLAPNPSLDDFIDKIELYTQANRAVFHHTRPMVDFIGSAPDYFHRIYRIQDLDEFMSDMNKRMGSELKLGHRQTGGPNIDADSLSTKQIEKLKARYEADYDAYGDYF